MKPTDLRLGNYIYEDTYYDPYKITEVTHLDPVSINYQNTYECKQPFEPIPLTEEWLIKFGFKVISCEKSFWNFKKGYFKYDYTIFEDISVGIDVDANYTEYKNVSFQYKNGDGIARKIEYVHQLQNLYFALTGSELQIKEEVIN